MQIGYRILDFWEITPYEFNLVINAYAENKKEHEDEMITQAYLTAYLQRVKKMPQLKTLIKSTQPKKVMTDDEMMKQVMKFNAMLGGEIIDGN